MEKEYFFLNKKNILILLFIISIIFNIIIYKNIRYEDRYINRYYAENIDNITISIHRADDLIGIITTLGFTDYKRSLNFLKCSGELKKASKFFELTSVYYAYNEREGGIKGNIDANKFFHGYTVVLENWAEAIYNNSQEQPSNQDIKDLHKDLQNIVNRFDNIKYELTYEKLNLLIEELVDETITKDIRSNLKVLFSGH